jgi:hypothetical protein
MPVYPSEIDLSSSTLRYLSRPVLGTGHAVAAGAPWTGRHCWCRPTCGADTHTPSSRPGSVSGVVTLTDR